MQPTGDRKRVMIENEVEREAKTSFDDAFAAITIKFSKAATNLMG